MLDIPHSDLDILAEHILLALWNAGIYSPSGDDAVVGKAPDMAKAVVDIFFGPGNWQPEGAPWPKPEQLKMRPPIWGI